MLISLHGLRPASTALRFSGSPRWQWRIWSSSSHSVGRDRRVWVRVRCVSSMASVKINEDVKYVVLPDRRRIAYREQGVGKEKAQRSLLVLHGLGSSRIAGMPGVSKSLLQEMGVRLVSIDRPGYGLSDFNPKQTFKSAAKDVADIADALEFGEKFWLLGYSCGGAYCWAAARFIPKRVAGIAMWAPVGNYWWKGITDSERNEIFMNVSRRTKSMYELAPRVPRWMLYAYVRYFIVPAAGTKWVEDAKKRLAPPDTQNLREVSGDLMERDSIESAKQKGKGMAQDLFLISDGYNWGFELAGVRSVYRGSIHIFNGDQDVLVPLSLQQCIQKSLSKYVRLHVLEGEGHISAFCYNEKVHRETLESLFGGGAKVRELDARRELNVGGEEQEVQNSGIVSETIKEGTSGLNALGYLH